MFNLKEKIVAFIEQEKEDHQNSLFDFDWVDSFAYYENDIKAAFNEWRESRGEAPLSDDQLQAVIDWAVENQDQCLAYRSPGFPYCPPNEFALVGNIGEIEVELPEYIKRHKSAWSVINRHTDLYISDAGYGYIGAEYDFIALCFESVPLGGVDA